MNDLVTYMVEPLVSHKDDMRIDVEEGDASVLIELRLHADDSARLHADDGRLLKAVQKVLAASAGTRKPVLDLVDGDSDDADDESSDASSDRSSDSDESSDDDTSEAG